MLDQLKNYSIQIKNVAPGIEQTLKSEKLNGNLNEETNRKKRQEVKKQLAIYIAKTYPNMSKADRGKYIQRANLTQWRKGFLTGSQGMGANQAFERIKENMKRNMDKNKKEKTTPPQKNNLNQKKQNLVSKIKKLKPTMSARQQGAATQVIKNTVRNFTQNVNKSKTQNNLNQIKKNFNSKVLKLQKQKWVY